MFGIDDAILGAVAGPLIGGLLGSGGSSQSQTQSNKMDSRLDPYVYGSDGKGGILGAANDWYQANKSGLNPQMLQGLNSQWNVLSDPATMGAYPQMSNLGSSLMSAPVMGNPFANGGASLSAPRPQNLGLSQPQQPQQQARYVAQPVTFGGGSQGPGPFTAPPPAPAQAPTQAAAPAPALSPAQQQLLDQLTQSQYMYNRY